MDNFVLKNVDPAQWKSTLTHSDFHQGIPGKRHVPGTPPWLIRHCSVWLIPLPYHEESSQGITFWNHRRYLEGYNDYSKQIAEERLLEVLPQLETMLEFLYSWRRELYWRRWHLMQCCLWIQSHYMSNLIYVPPALKFKISEVYQEIVFMSFVRLLG
jgi:hypothetical protein